MSKIFDIASRKNATKTAKDYYREHQVITYLWPDAWRDVTFPQLPNWQEVKFGGSDTKKIIPSKPGVYALRINIDHSAIPCNGLIAYFGISGDSLRDRYDDYLHEKEKGSKRPMIGELLDLWGNSLDFVFWVIERKLPTLKKIEKRLNDAVMPPFNINDFDGEVRRIRKVLP